MDEGKLQKRRKKNSKYKKEEEKIENRVKNDDIGRNKINQEEKIRNENKYYLLLWQSSVRETRKQGGGIP